MKCNVQLTETTVTHHAHHHSTFSIQCTVQQDIDDGQWESKDVKRKEIS